MSDNTETAAAQRGDMPFELHQMFYSRTDKRGVIQSGNAVFQEISGYPWEKLIGAPHRIVRNRDTPRAVFRVMWSLIQSDQIAVAYVRNKTADGRGYWVIAAILPIEDGYLSVRIKPTSPLFEQVRKIYAELSAAEQEQSLSVEDSEKRLLAELAKLGFDSYDQFQRTALQAEFRARSIALGVNRKTYYADVDRIESGMTAIISAQGKLLEAVESLRDLPTNMRILASRMEPSGGPLSAMSDIYNSTSSLLFQEIQEFVLGKNRISKRVQEAFAKFQFSKTISMLMSEVAASTAKGDAAGSGVDATEEANRIGRIFAQTSAAEAESLQVMERQSEDLNREAYDLRRSMLGLDTIRVMGLVESGRLGPEGSRIGATMEQIGESHATTITLLQGIKDNSTVVSAGVEGLRLEGRKAAALAAR